MSSHGCVCFINPVPLSARHPQWGWYSLCPTGRTSSFREEIKDVPPLFSFVPVAIPLFVEYPSLKWSWWLVGPRHPFSNLETRSSGTVRYLAMVTQLAKDTDSHSSSFPHLQSFHSSTNLWSPFNKNTSPDTYNGDINECASKRLILNKLVHDYLIEGSSEQ